MSFSNSWQFFCNSSMSSLLLIGSSSVEALLSLLRKCCEIQTGHATRAFYVHVATVAMN